ncbi:energy-coupling factor transporter transmembrane component T family protein [Azospirillum rugosum]|uniref:Biotin transport system permease protein n=1 Tax=Azospirillum rugosum TaxID=416170 RepID=A0ABS4SVG0_9PROT|nr:energy-coupling factor transporter transmembrane protein EcfT [Azospirillum rugosum]MBP2296048.1 biotin transport system permease protein [Azospirillum rugosum]MDQ0529638.1 biotin transport system permease protein [Azospirillum rugosum]
MLGLYLHRDSPVHAFPVGWKLAALAVAATGLFFVSNPVAIGAALVGALGLFALARLPLGAVLGQIRPLLPVLVLLFAVQAAFAGWETGAATAGRLALLVLLASLVTLTTRASDTIDALERGLGWLRPLGVNAGKVSLMLALTIRLIPVLLDLVQEIRMAQRARGVERSALALLVPLLVKTMRMADHLSDALEARGYDPR